MTSDEIETLSDLDLMGAIECCGLEGDDIGEFVSDLADTFVADASERIRQLDKWLSAETVEDPKLVIRTAHTLRGSCANMGAQKLQHIFGLIEDAVRAGDIASARDLIPTAKNFYTRLLEILEQEKLKFHP